MLTMLVVPVSYCEPCYTVNDSHASNTVNVGMLAYWHISEAQEVTPDTP